MTDLEITKLCAEAMGLPYFDADNSLFPKAIVAKEPSLHVYAPLDDDAQAMAILKQFKLAPRFAAQYVGGPTWVVTHSYENAPCGTSADLNRAICECVAKMQASK